MSRLQAIHVRVAMTGVGLLAAALALAACSHHGGSQPAASTASAASHGATASFTAFHGVVPSTFTSTQCSLDDVNGQPATSPPPLAAGSAVTFRGWAGNGQAQPAEGFALVLASVQNSYAAPLSTGVSRQDVATALHSPAMVPAGYDLTAKLSGVAAGTYAVYIVNPSDGSQDCNPQRTLIVQ